IVAEVARAPSLAGSSEDASETSAFGRASGAAPLPLGVAAPALPVPLGALGSLGESNVPPGAATFYWPHRCEGTPQTHLTPLGDPHDAPAAGMVRHARVFDAERSKDGPLMLSERLAEPLHETSFAVFVKT